MINKIKDFLKNKIRRQKTSETDEVNEIEDQTGSYQLDQESQEELQSAQEELNQEPPEEIESSEEIESAELETSDEVTGSKPSLKDRLLGPITGLKGRIKKPNINISLPSSAAASQLLSPSLSKWVEKALSRQTREPIHQVFLVTFIATLTYMFGKTTALVLKGAPTVAAPKTSMVTIPIENDFNAGTLNQVKGINIFRTNAGLGQKKVLADTKCENAQQTSSLPIKLLNTTVLQDSVKSMASVQVRGERLLQEYRVGEDIANLAKIFKITRLELLVKNLESGVCESIISDKGQIKKSPISMMGTDQARAFRQNKKMPGIENVGNKFIIKKDLLDEKIKDIGSILTQAKALKIQNPDGSLSFKMTEMDPEGIFPYLGLQDQDIITSINGKPIYDLNEVMGLFARIKNLDNLSLGVKREGSEAVQEYSIKK